MVKPLGIVIKRRLLDRVRVLALENDMCMYIYLDFSFFLFLVSLVVRAA